jgi:Ca2+-binding EF-hand superfamily protein
MKRCTLPILLALSSCNSGPGPITPQTRVERQMVGLLEKFDRWDEDGNGKLTASELKEAEKRSGQPAAKIIDFYDTNGDRAITLREAQDGYSRAEEAEKKARL